MDPAEPYTSISVLLGDESSIFMGNVGGSTPPAMQNGNLYTLVENDVESAAATSGTKEAYHSRVLNDKAYPSNILLSFPIHAR
jgi:hypothetical protein